ncbi:nitroreductase family deazaflavin-dependent oxidoreductase [Nocardia sp. NPDC088792]|uniref:nitroreductase family deazaflavin-dependent oxidoreductase n=1 Tax=Nocardia sp. NPDC088792 TaxID=3364332 RepID=UPI0037FEF8C9
MSNKQQTNNNAGRKSGTPGAFSRWMQRKMNSRMNSRIRRGDGKFMGMEVLILHTIGRRSGAPRQSPVTWFADGERAWLLVASGGGSQNPDWYANLVAHPEQASVQLPGRDQVAVTPHRLEGADRAEAWQRITAAQPRYGKYQSKSEREYPVVRLSAR